MTDVNVDDDRIEKGMNFKAKKKQGDLYGDGAGKEGLGWMMGKLQMTLKKILGYIVISEIYFHRNFAK